MNTGSVDRTPQPGIPRAKRDTTPPTEAAAPGPKPRWHSSDLFGSAQDIEIEHGGAVYRLRQTALGKLILTK